MRRTVAWIWKNLFKLIVLLFIGYLAQELLFPYLVRNSMSWILGVAERMSMEHEEANRILFTVTALISNILILVLLSSISVWVIWGIGRFIYKTTPPNRLIGLSAEIEILCRTMNRFALIERDPHVFERADYVLGELEKICRITRPQEILWWDFLQMIRIPARTGDIGRVREMHRHLTESSGTGRQGT